MQFGTFHSLVSVPGYLQDLNLKVNEIDHASSASKKDISQSKSDFLALNKNKEENDPANYRGRRDPRNLLYYINTMGNLHFGLFIFFVTIEAVFVTMQCK